MEQGRLNHIFGPVPSRRLGYSLGIDIMPFKTCSYDCIYCQLGPTTLKTIERREYVPVNELIQELKTKLKAIVSPDYVTVSGSGEPTLHSGIGELIKEVKSITDIPVAVLTNGSLLFMDVVRKSLMNADLVLPSLDAGDEMMFRKINRPHPDISFDEMSDGIMNFCNEYKGRTWLEVFFVDGVNANESEIIKIVSKTQKINPDKVQLNTCDRPAAKEFVRPVSTRHLKEILSSFSDNAEIIAGNLKAHDSTPTRRDLIRDEIINLLKRRPCRINDISLSTGLSPNEALKTVDTLIRLSDISAEISGQELFYKFKGAF
jgi:wyosine [tRNA(Phe)-imidazoG37] synthetase (radical SAM superfamily)